MNDAGFYGRSGRHFGVCMAYFRKLLIVSLLLAPIGAIAGYASLSPPSGYSGSGTARSYARAAANESTIAGNTVRTNASLSVGGRSVTMPVSMRYAANASRVAARFAFANPALMIVAGAVEAYQYYQDGGFELDGDTWKKKVATPGTMYRVNGTIWYVSESAACSAFIRGLNDAMSDTTGIYWEQGSSPGLCGYGGETYGWLNGVRVRTTPMTPATAGYVTKTDLVFNPEKYPVATPQEFEDGMAPLPFPDSLPDIIKVPLPVEEPVVNPSNEPVPRPQPMRVPMGDPQPVPSTIPEQYRTPVVDIVPSPTPTDPWRVDLQPKDLQRTDPTPITDPYPVSLVPLPDETTTPKTEDAPTPGLCELFPDILACAKPDLDTPEVPELENQNREILLNPDTGWGGGSGSCPSPRHLNGANVDFSFASICDGLSKFRPLVLAFAWLAAAFILLGVRQGGE